MSLLSDMIQKRERKQTTSGAGGQSVLPVATATVATFATVQAKTPPTVATVASVAVANTQTVFAWRVSFLDRSPITASFSPEATRAEVMACYPNANAIAPLESYGIENDIFNEGEIA